MKLTSLALSVHIDNPHTSEYTVDHTSYSARGSFNNQRVLIWQRRKTLACGPLISEVNYLSLFTSPPPSIRRGMTVGSFHLT